MNREQRRLSEKMKKIRQGALAFLIAGTLSVSNAPGMPANASEDPAGDLLIQGGGGGGVVRSDLTRSCPL